MKVCLHCKDEFEEKKPTAKYCSTSCRVMYNRNKPKQNKSISTETKLEVLCNAILDKLNDVKFVPVTASSFEGGGKNGFIEDESVMFPTKPKIRRSYENYQQLKLDCENIEAWEELKAEIIASDLPKSQKTILIS